MSIIVALVLCWGEHVCFHPFLSLSFSFFSCSDTPDKGISDGFDQIWLPREITHLAWSSNEMILLLQSKHKHSIHREGTEMGDGFIRHLFSPPWSLGWKRDESGSDSYRLCRSASWLLCGRVDQWRKHTRSLSFTMRPFVFLSASERQPFSK